MNFEILKKNHLTRNIIIGIIVIALITTLILNFTRAKYRTTQSVPLINGTITYIPYDLNIVAIYQENEAGGYDEVDVVPTSGYALNTSESYCAVDDVKDENITIEYVDGKINILGTSQKGTKCYLYFDIFRTASEVILADKTIQERASFSSVLTSNTNGVIYQAPDGEGTSYYFAGNTTENWLSFAGFYWRIIRINGDGTVRIIYNGTSTSTTGTSTQLSGISAFNNLSNSNMYMGYMYTSGYVHGLGKSSTIKGRVDEWYQNNIANNKKYTSKISITTGFCGDRSNYRNTTGTTSGGGTGTTTTYYGAYIRLDAFKEVIRPTYDCPYNEDLYTVDGAGIGNEALTYPVGLITADEVVYAGGRLGSNNSSYYLYTNQQYWTMSPYYYAGSQAYLLEVHWDGYLTYYYSGGSCGIRPVLNLKADVQLSGTGTSTDPFIVN